MFKRLKMWTYFTALFSGSLLAGGCGGGLGVGDGWMGLDNIPRIIVAILQEDLFG